METQEQCDVSQGHPSNEFCFENNLRHGDGGVRTD